MHIFCTWLGAEPQAKQVGVQQILRHHADEWGGLVRGCQCREPQTLQKPRVVSQTRPADISVQYLVATALRL
jgi:hypothetical protein